jgi:hypothetical protein
MEKFAKDRIEWSGQKLKMQKKNKENIHFFSLPMDSLREVYCPFRVL